MFWLMNEKSWKFMVRLDNFQAFPSSVYTLYTMKNILFPVFIYFVFVDINIEFHVTYDYGFCDDK